MKGASDRDSGKTGAAPTPAGVRFQRYAQTMTWASEQARQEVALPPGYRAQLRCGGQFSLWDGLLPRWLRWMRAASPAVALHTEVGQPDGLMRQLGEGLLDIGVMYTPQSRPGLVVEQPSEERLVLVSTRRDSTAPMEDGYVYVDWGPEFQTAHGMRYPDLPMPGLYVGLGALALSYIRQSGGAGYFPLRVVRPYLDRGELFPVPGTASFARPAHVVYPTARDDELLATAVEGLRLLAAQETEDATKPARTD